MKDIVKTSNVTWAGSESMLSLNLSIGHDIHAVRRSQPVSYESKRVPEPVGLHPVKFPNL
jgi:hypothetical protein